MKQTAKQLKEKYDKDLESLKKSCKHEKVSGWLGNCDFHGNVMHKVKQCEICWTILFRRPSCSACQKNYVIEEKDHKPWEQLCPECSK